MINQEIERRVDAYRGNPQALMQRYQQSQQLIDLLALQKLKSDKEAAARQMQLAMSQEGPPPTVAQQREQEVSDMTRQEVVQQVGQLAQAQQQSQQQQMQKMMRSGIAQAPGAQMAAQPQAMAAGGIVAFQSGDLVSSPRGRSAQLSPGTRRRMEQTREEERRRQAIERVREEERLQAERRLAPEAVEGLGSTPTIPAEASLFAAEELPPAAQAEPARAAEAIPYAGPDERYAPNLAAPREERAAAPAAMSAADQARQATPMPAGLGALAQGQGQYNRLQQALAGMMGPEQGDPDQQKAIADFRALLDESKRPQFPAMMGEQERQARLEARRKEQQEQFDPEKTRYQNLINFFLGGAGRTGIGSVLGGAGAAGLQSQVAQEAAQRAGAREIRDLEEGLLQRREAYEKEKFGVQQAERKLQLDAHRALMDTIQKISEGNKNRENKLATAAMELAARADISENEMKTKLAIAAADAGVKISEGQLNRLTELVKIEANAKAAGETRAAQQDIKSETNYREVKKDYANQMAKLDKEYNDAIANPMNLSADKQKAIEASYRAERARISREYVPFLNRYEVKEGLPKTQELGASVYQAGETRSVQAGPNKGKTVVWDGQGWKLKE
jgi:hypothetical protein